MPFENNIFINCPFDKTYKKFLDAILFTVIYCDFEPQISETNDSGRNRLDNIISLIHNSKYSIHDLCRMQAKKQGELSRFNMPFELGIDIGARTSGIELFKDKKCLILDSQKYRYQAAISDISGNDIEAYVNLQNLIRVIRNWLRRQQNADLLAPKLIWEDYNVYKVHLEESLISDGFHRKDIDNLPKSEFIELAKEWINQRKIALKR
jgi:hypothetical protein